MQNEELKEVAERVRLFIQDSLDAGPEGRVIGNLMSARDDVDRILAALRPSTEAGGFTLIGSQPAWVEPKALQSQVTTHEGDSITVEELDLERSIAKIIDPKAFEPSDDLTRLEANQRAILRRQAGEKAAAIRAMIAASPTPPEVGEWRPNEALNTLRYLASIAKLRPDRSAYIDLDPQEYRDLLNRAAPSGGEGND